MDLGVMTWRVVEFAIISQQGQTEGLGQDGWRAAG
jgi:hypothetical protein